MQPPTWLPALRNGVQCWPLGHSLSEVHITMPVQEPLATQLVLVILCAKLPVHGSRPIDAPGAQHTGFAASLQSATGSSQPQSTAPAPQAVPLAVQAEVPIAGSQQCCVDGSQ